MSYRDLIEQVLHKAGAKKVKATHEGFVCCCPFHDDSSPSFAVSEEGAYICYSSHCGETGNLYNLLTKLGGYSHSEAFELVRSLPRSGDLSKAGLLPAYEDRRRRPAATVLDESLVSIYRAATPKYMLDRGFSELTLRAFDVGYDRENRQVVIPVRSPQGKLAGFIRRSIDKDAHLRYYVDVPKEGRRGILFNLHKVESREGILVEATLDCMWLWQKGLKNGVALLGASLSKEQEKLIKDRFDTITLMMDNDRDGLAATEKIIPRLRRWVDVYVSAPFPTGKDAQDNTGLSLWQCYENRVPALRWLVDRRVHSKGEIQ